MSKHIRTVPRRDATHGVVQRDVSLIWEREMERRYGLKWRKVLREKGIGDEEKAILQKNMARSMMGLPPVTDEPPVEVHLEDSNNE